MTDDTYTASFLGDDGQEARTEQLESIGGQPQKSLVRPAADGGDDVNWELDPDASTEGNAVYRSLGVAQHDYS
ncbi:hypothetical protein [Frigoribacterium sp. PhB116]|uniref:hypothetical protein n=1 Tax=Frigoribacterium sp. PhB116 TaxID=2485174 RepID=UPI00105F5F16|nr:hypothetical protein [Frigoribacterium sp. PhB116]TDT66166.1 hypothetical protein EDF20_0973 [Frigoribacterium sp. PhB116]